EALYAVWLQSDGSGAADVHRRAVLVLEVELIRERVVLDVPHDPVDGAVGVADVLQLDGQALGEVDGDATKLDHAPASLRRDEAAERAAALRRHLHLTE